MARRVSRRTFLQAAATTTAATYAARVLPAGANAISAKQSRGRRFGRLKPGSIAVDTPLTTFAYSDVTLLDGPMKRQFEENHARFLNLDDDRLLKVFRQVAGLPAPGEDMGGWYDLTGFSLERNDFHGFIAGHTLRTICFWTGAGVRRHRIRTDARENQSPGQGLRRNARPQSEVLRRLSLAGLHLRQAFLRPD